MKLEVLEKKPTEKKVAYASFTNINDMNIFLTKETAKI